MQLRSTLLLALVGIAIYNLFFYLSQPTGIGTGLWLIVLNSYFFLIRNRQTKNLDLGLVSSGLAILFGFLASFRGNELVQLIDIGLSSFFSLAAVYFYKQPERVSLNHKGILAIPIIAAIEGLISSILFITKQDSYSASKSDPLTPAILRGFAIAVPILIVLTVILSMADPVFSKTIGDIMEDLWLRLILSLIWFVALVGTGISSIKYTLKEKESTLLIAIGKAHELVVVTGSIILLFAGFIFIQFKYLFSTVGERELGNLGVKSLTYSEYVTRGFFELLIAASIAALVVIYALRYLHRLTGNQKQLVQILTGVLTLEIGLLLLSAVKRVALYADSHGLTRAREFGFIFLIWLAGILALLLIRVFLNWRSERFASSGIIVTIIALLSLNLINIDGLSATKYRPTVNNEIDYFYLTSISVDAHQSWVPAIQEAQKVISELESKKDLTAEDSRKWVWASKGMTNLEKHLQYLYNKHAPEGKREHFGKWHVLPPETINRWSSFNFADYQAYQYLQDNRQIFEEDFPKVRQQLGEIDKLFNPHIKNTTPIDRSVKAPLTR